ncbi:MAG: HYR domain-containing protein [Gemmatimonadota bacterium]|nr:HYR domain-containing protein [Gemmatimonadota bacterium]
MIAATLPPIRMAGIGLSAGNRAANIVFSSGDLNGSIARIGEAQFNAMTVAQLRASYDVLLFTWASSPSLNADWTTRLLPFMQLGGGIIWEDDSNIGDLSPAVVALPGGYSSWALSPVPGLTDGISGRFANSHIRFTSWISTLHPFITTPSSTEGLYGEFGAGRIVLTGPDQDYHSTRASDQYNFLVNEIRWVAAGSSAPTITAPANVTANTDPGVCVATAVVAGTPTASDGATITSARSDGLGLDAPYPKGVTTITWTATGANTLTATATQTVTVTDNQPPTIVAPPNRIANTDPGSPTATLSVGATATDNCPDFTLSGPSGFQAFPIGTVTLRWVATDASGNTSAASQQITVNDVEPPKITVPASFTVNATMPTGAYVTYLTPASDNSGSVTVVCDHPSASVFAIGTTLTTCTATDGSGNTASGTFSVRVLGAAEQIANLAEFMRGTAIPEPYRTQLVSALTGALSDPRSQARACPALNFFIMVVRAKAPYIPALAAKAPQIISDASRIKGVIGCP